MDDRRHGATGIGGSAAQAEWIKIAIVGCILGLIALILLLLLGRL